MPELSMAVNNRVIARDRFGRFTDNVKKATSDTVRELVEEGMNLSRSLAPTGTKHDRRTAPLRASLYMVMESRTRGYWGSNARHALAVEHGARPHIIPGNPGLKFWWEAEGRMWIPAAKYYGIPGLQDFVNHPGNDAQPFLRPAYDEIMRRMHGKMRKNFANL
jgi:hypothetical protein